MPKTSSKIKKKDKLPKTTKGRKKDITKKEKLKKTERETRMKKEIEKPLLIKEKPEKYWAGVGRRKTSVALAKLFAKGEKKFLVNDKPYQKYFPTLDCWQIASASLEKMKVLNRLGVFVKVKGGGYHSQAEAVRHAIAWALVKFNPNFRKRLRRVGYLTRDSRMRERKKFGLKRARRAPQWQKR